jgi:protein-arginine kinase activator protein McsA
MKFQTWKEAKGRFDDVDLGRKSIPNQILIYRRNLANQLKELLEEPEFQDVTLVQDLINRLENK